MSRFTSSQRRLGKSYRRCRDAFVLVGESRYRHRNFAGESRKFGEHAGINLYPLSSDPDESSGEVTIEYTLAATNTFLALPQDAF